MIKIYQKQNGIITKSIDYQGIDVISVISDSFFVKYMILKIKRMTDKPSDSSVISSVY